MPELSGCVVDWQLTATPASWHAVLPPLLPRQPPSLPLLVAALCQLSSAEGSSEGGCS
jgi:hypothetical protein